MRVIDIQSGAIVQEVRIDLVGEIARAVLVDGDEIYIAGGEREVVVLPFAGSEA